MEEAPSTTAGMVKRVRAQMEKDSLEVDETARIKATWEYLENVKKLQELEMQIETIKALLKKKESRFPDLKALRGTVEHLCVDKFWEVEDDGKKKVIAGKSLEEATEKFRKKKAQEVANKAKQKAGPSKANS